MATVEQVKRIVRICCFKKVIFVRGEKTRCPVCEHFQLPVVDNTSHSKTTSGDGVTIRQHVCHTCGKTFQSIEEIKIAALEQETIVLCPEIVDKKPKKRQIKSRRRV